LYVELLYLAYSSLFGCIQTHLELKISPLVVSDPTMLPPLETMDPINLGDMIRKISAIWQDAKLKGYKPEDLLPPDMLEHFQNIADLKRAKEYIKEVEEREKVLQCENEGLRTALIAEKKKVEDIPEDYKALQVDYKQLEKRAEYYKDLMKREEERAQTYFTQWKQLSLDRVITSNTDKTVEALEQENEQLKVAIIKLIEENRAAGDLFAQLREHDKATLEEKELQLAAMNNFLFQTESQYQQLEQESDGFEQAYHDLVTRMEDENAGAATALNITTAKMRHMECIQIAAASEARILAEFYNASFRALSVFEEIFHELLCTDKHEPEIRWLPSDLQHLLHSAGKEVEAFEEVHQMFDLEHLEVDEVRMELIAMANTGKMMHESLQTITFNAKKFLVTLRQKPDIWNFVRRKFRQPSQKL
jgi:chromosome segregation ATPase